ncbi:MAG: anthranilate synthase component I family protein, partial [Vicinamibacteria bacterium]
GPCVLFESTTAPGPLARLSLLARHPRAILVSDRAGTRVATASGVAAVTGDPMDALRALLRAVPPGAWPDEGGVAGVLAYDYARPGRPAAPTPLLFALAVDRFLVDDGTRVVGDGPHHPPVRAFADEPWTRPLEPRARAGTSGLAAWSSLSREDHRALVLRVKEHVAAGDIYQANLSQRFQLPFAAGGLDLYRQLRTLSPAPFSGYVRAPGFEIASASPERLLEVRDGFLATRPIAGTRPRSHDPSADRALRAELLLSEKERAEHLMLVDLARNDLGRVASLGSVSVDELMAVEDYAQVRHIVSNVRARLADGRDPLDALGALFPGGTITGVPKVRCMRILDALEPVPRGFYTGALFYLTPSGRLDANILIRSAVVAGGAATFHTGGGIVADSDPDHEYRETLHKAEGLRLALLAAGATGLR